MRLITLLIIVRKKNDILQFTRQVIVSEKSRVKSLCTLFLFQDKTDIADLVTPAVILGLKAFRRGKCDRILMLDQTDAGFIISVPIIIPVTDIISLPERTPFCGGPVVFIIQAQVVKVSRGAQIDGAVALQDRNLQILGKRIIGLSAQIAYGFREMGIEIEFIRDVIRTVRIAGDIDLCIKRCIKGRIRLKFMVDVFC